MTLTQALRRKAKEDAEAVWQKARADAESHRAAKARAYEEQRARAAEQLAAVSAELARRANSDAERGARRILATSKAALSDRLYRLAVETLGGLRDSELFEALAAELPARVWERVRVHPADQSIALKLFPRAEVVCDPGIAGGMDVEVEQGRVRIINTLEARLQAAWPEILPALMKDVLEEMSHS
ncbi:MAG TPA: V-type ATP synthase subunit E [Thermoanaerobaculia bacterium]|nr:V-type ATP synthase subunit E [Thermoanaerobaculia bacterium]